MEGTEVLKCSQCDEPPQVKCYCLEMPVALCTKCSVKHFLEDTALLHRPFPVASKEANEKELCGVCKVCPAVSICTCMYPWISYCHDCASVHMASEVGDLKHSLEPLHAREFLRNVSDLSAFYDRQFIIEELETEVRQNVVAIAECIEQVNSMALKLIATIEGWRDITIRKLLEVQEKINQNVEVSCEQLEKQRYEAKIDPSSRIEQIIGLCTRENVATLKKEASMLKFTIDPERLMGQLPYILKVSENYLMLEPVNKLFYLVPRSNKLVSLDLPDLKPKETVMNADFKFKSACAWCKLQSGEVFLCGGVRQHKGATYYKEAAVIDPSTKSVRMLPSMKTTRCRHAVIHYRDSLYVFGGYNESLLKSCEKFDIIENAWSDLPDLREGKDCVSACVWRDKAYIVGYGSNRVEIYDFPTGNMIVMPTSFRTQVMNLLVPRHCFIVGILNGEMTIMMESEMLKINVDSYASRTMKLPNKLERAWYSQCPAAVVKGEHILFFTLDQELWRLTLTSNELKLVLTVK